MKKIFTLLFLFVIIFVDAQNPKLIKNLSGTITEPNSNFNSSDFWPANQWNGLTFYQGTGSPVKLCVTDGTDAGTKFLLDIGTGAIHKIIPAKDFVYIITVTLVSSSPFTNRYQIWKTNGTSSGTSLVTILPDAVGISNANQFCSDPQSMFNYGMDGTTNKLYFNGYDAINGNELWVTDGTAAGTTIVKDIKPGAGGSIPWGFMKIGNEVFFNSMEVGLERKLWKTDGTAAGTVRINVPEPFFVVNGSIGKLGNKMIFFANNTTDGFEPYVSDGTPSGTFMLGNFHLAGNGLTPYVEEANLKSNGKYCFLVLQNGTDTSLYRTDGTVAGTIRVAPAGMSIYTRLSTGGYVDVNENGIWIVKFNNTGGGNAETIYRSNGTPEGTYLVAQNISYGQKVKIYRNGLWMQARNTGTVNNVEPWRSGGNQETTNKAFEIAPGGPVAGFFYSSEPYGYHITNNRLYFFATNAGGNPGLYEYNGDFTFNGSVAGGNWRDSANWNSAMPPGIVDTVYVNAGTPNSLNVNNTKAYAGTLIMGNNATINITNGADSLYIASELIPGSNVFITGNGVVSTNSFNGNNVSIKSGLTISSLVLESNTNLQTGNLSLTNSLTLLKGSLTLNTANAVMKGSGSIITTLNNNYVITNNTGNLQIENIGSGGRTGTVVFPVGNTTYNPVSISNSGTTDAFGARVITGISTAYTGETPGTLLTSSAVNRTWMITEGSVGGSNANITLQWNASDELPSFDRNATVLGHYTGGTWTVGSTAAASGTNPYTYSRAGITSFSPFGILNSIATPVTNWSRNVISVNVFPNPAKEYLQVMLTEQMQKEDLTIQLFNANGQIVLQKIMPASRVGMTIINLKEFNSGIYYLQLKGRTIHAYAIINLIK